MKQKNGKIELMRFVFAVMTMLLNMSTNGFWKEKLYLWKGFNFFYHGYISVEFFFVLSGFLMANSIYKQVQNDATHQRLPGEIADETRHFLWRKIKALLPYHLTLSAIGLVIFLTWKHDDLAETLLQKLPGLFFLQRTGIPQNESFVAVEWYLASMLLAMAILYPLCRRFYLNFSHLAAPLSALLILGYMSQTEGHLSGVSQWSVLTYYCNLRAIAEICLGITCFEIYRNIRDRELRTWQKALATVAEAGCYLTVLRYACSDADSHFDFYALFLVCVAITLSFSRLGLLGQSGLFQNRICYLLGGVSLPLYMSHFVVKMAVLHWFADWRLRYRGILYIVASMLLAFALYFLFSNRRAGRRAA